MSLPRFFTDEVFAPTVQVAALADKDIHHAVRVLRLKLGEEIELVDGEGQVLHLLLTRCSTNEVSGDILSRRVVSDEGRPELHVLQGLPRGSKIDEIIQKGVELGMHRLYPLLTRQSQIRLDKDGGRKKQERWAKIAEMAASQSGRHLVPEVMEPESLESRLRALRDEDLAASRSVLNIICWENERVLSLAALLKNQGLKDKAIVRVLVGPEGGFADEEVEIARDLGFIPITLGETILRTETAAPAVLAMLGFALDYLDRS